MRSVRRNTSRHPSLATQSPAKLLASDIAALWLLGRLGRGRGDAHILYTKTGPEYGIFSTLREWRISANGILTH